MFYKDMTFCSNKECKIRKICYRAIENHITPRDVVYSVAEFLCTEGREEFFRRIEKAR